jgi:hypothetical protein
VPSPGLRPLDVLRLQRLGGNQAVQRLLMGQTSPDEPAGRGPVSVQRPCEPSQVLSRAAPLGAPLVAPTAAGDRVSVYWLPDRMTRETHIVTQSSTTLTALGLYLYGDAAASVDLAALNGRDPVAPLEPGARLKVAPLAGRKPTPEAARDFNASPWWPVDVREPSALLARMGVSSPAEFPPRKRELDVQLEQDFQVIIAKLNEAHYSDADEGKVLDILRRWGEEKLTTQPGRYPNGGDYLEQLFSRLRRKTKDVGIVTDQLSDYYSLMFNHFGRVDELKVIRDTYSPSYRRDSGFQESSLGSFFWDEVKKGAVRDQIFAYFKGVGKGAWSGLKGTFNFAKTLVTHPGKAWEQIKSMPSAMKKLWKNRQALWNQFVSASPEEQAEIIGKLVGEVEFALASSAAGGAAARGVASLAEAPGWLGKTARMVGAVTSVPGKIVGQLRKAAAGAAELALSPLRSAAQSVSGSLRGLFARLRSRWTGSAAVVEEIDAEIASRLAQKVPRLTERGTRTAAGELHLKDGSEPAQFFEKAKRRPGDPAPTEGLTAPERHVLRPDEQRLPNQPTEEVVPVDEPRRTEYLEKNRVEGHRPEHAGPRSHDAEAKVLERASAHLAKTPQATGVLHLRPSHPPCPACTSAIFNFTGRHPYVRVILH